MLIFGTPDAEDVKRFKNSLIANSVPFEEFQGDKVCCFHHEQSKHTAL